MQKIEGNTTKETPSLQKPLAHDQSMKIKPEAPDQIRQPISMESMSQFEHKAPQQSMEPMKNIYNQHISSSRSTYSSKL